MPDSNGKRMAQFFLVLIQKGGDNLNDHAFREIQMELAAFDSSPDETQIDMLLESPGGDSSAAYRLLLDLQARCRKLRVVVPDRAKGAATLLVLGADEIFMGASADLGPLDAQVEHPNREGVNVSALEASKGLQFVGNFAVDQILGGAAPAFRSSNLPRIETLREFSSFAAAFLEPVVCQLDPHLMCRAVDQLQITRKYAKIALKSRRLSAEEKQRMGEAEPEDLVKHLVEGYQAHDSVMSRTEAHDLPLPVRKLEEYEFWKQLWIFHTLRACSPESALHLWTESELDSLLEEKPALAGRAKSFLRGRK